MPSYTGNRIFENIKVVANESSEWQWGHDKELCIMVRVNCYFVPNTDGQQWHYQVLVDL